MGFAIVVGSPGTGIPGGMGANVGLTGFGSLGATGVSIGGWSGSIDTYSINTNPILAYLIGAAAAGTQMSPAQLQFIQSYQVATPAPVATTPITAPPVAPAPPVVVAPAPVVIVPQPVLPSAPVPIVPIGTPTGSGITSPGTIVPVINPIPSGLVPGGGVQSIVPAPVVAQPITPPAPPPPLPPAPQPTVLQQALKYLEQQILSLPAGSVEYQQEVKIIDTATNWLTNQVLTDITSVMTKIHNFLVNTWPYLAWPFYTPPGQTLPPGGTSTGGHAGYIDPPVGVGLLTGAPTPIFPVNPECSQCKQGVGPIYDEETF